MDTIVADCCVLLFFQCRQGCFKVLPPTPWRSVYFQCPLQCLLWSCSQVKQHTGKRAVAHLESQESGMAGVRLRMDAAIQSVWQRDECYTADLTGIWSWSTCRLLQPEIAASIVAQRHLTSWMAENWNTDADYCDSDGPFDARTPSTLQDIVRPMAHEV